MHHHPGQFEGGIQEVSPAWVRWPMQEDSKACPLDSAQGSAFSGWMEKQFLVEAPMPSTGCPIHSSWGHEKPFIWPSSPVWDAACSHPAFLDVLIPFCQVTQDSLSSWHPGTFSSLPHSTVTYWRDTCQVLSNVPLVILMMR